MYLSEQIICRNFIKFIKYFITLEFDSFILEIMWTVFHDILVEINYCFFLLFVNVSKMALRLVNLAKMVAMVANSEMLRN